jgi:DinB superfamily
MVADDAHQPIVADFSTAPDAGTAFDDGIVPDDKDWTWVLERPCPECGFDASTFPAVEVAPLIRSNAQAWSRLLSVVQPSDRSRLRHRPRPDRWAPLEYACHVRDVFVLYGERLRLMLDEDEPLYPNWDQDTTAVRDRYADQDIGTVAAQLAEAASSLAAAFESVKECEWQRTGRRSDGASFTVDSFSRYMVHDPVHHLFDVTGERTGPRSSAST